MLLEVPNPDDPQDGEVATMMRKDPVRFAQKAQEWAISYAGAPKRELDLAPFEALHKAQIGKEGRQGPEYVITLKCNRQGELGLLTRIKQLQGI